MFGCDTQSFLLFKEKKNKMQSTIRSHYHSNALKDTFTFSRKALQIPSNNISSQLLPSPFVSHFPDRSHILGFCSMFGYSSFWWWTAALPLPCQQAGVCVDPALEAHPHLQKPLPAKLVPRVGVSFGAGPWQGWKTGTDTVPQRGSLPSRPTLPPSLQLLIGKCLLPCSSWLGTAPGRGRAPRGKHTGDPR